MLTGQIYTVVKVCYMYSNRGIIFIVHPMFTSIRMQFLTFHYISSVIYHLKCQCDDGYICRSGHMLEATINQEISVNIRKGNLDNYHRSVNTSGPVTDEHLKTKKNYQYSLSSEIGTFRF